MATSNWIELSALLLSIAVGLTLWRVCKARFRRQGGIEGVVTERGKPSWRPPMDLEDEIEQLKAELGRK